MADIAVETSEAQEAIKNLVLKAEEKEGGGEMKEVDIANNIYWIISFEKFISSVSYSYW